MSIALDCLRMVLKKIIPRSEEQGALGFVAGKEAADVYKQLAGIHHKLGSGHEEASCWVEAAKALTKIPSDGTHEAPTTP